MELVQLGAAVAQLRAGGATLTDVEIEDRFLALLSAAVEASPPSSVERVVVDTIVTRLHQLVELRRARQLEADRHLAQLFARVEALEGARVEIAHQAIGDPGLRL